MAKLRGQSQRRDPGGGGINVARVIRRLGGDARAIYPVGGAIGKLLRQLLDQEGVASHTWTIAGETRENFFVDEISAGSAIPRRKAKDNPHVALQCLGPSPAWLNEFVEKASAEAPATAKDLSEGHDIGRFT